MLRVRRTRVPPRVAAQVLRRASVGITSQRRSLGLTGAMMGHLGPASDVRSDHVQVDHSRAEVQWPQTSRDLRLSSSCAPKLGLFSRGAGAEVAVEQVTGLRTPSLPGMVVRILRPRTKPRIFPGASAGRPCASRYRQAGALQPGGHLAAGRKGPRAAGRPSRCRCAANAACR